MGKNGVISLFFVYRNGLFNGEHSTVDTFITFYANNVHLYEDAYIFNSAKIRDEANLPHATSYNILTARVFASTRYCYHFVNSFMLFLSFTCAQLHQSPFVVSTHQNFALVRKITAYRHCNMRYDKDQLQNVQSSILIVR